MLPWTREWTKTTALTEHHEPFTSPEQAWERWHEFAANSDVFNGAQARLVEVTRRVGFAVAEPIEGWETYHRRMALAAADRAIRPAGR